MNIRPFLKWAGNKYQVLPHILPLLPQGKRLIEPFAGSGAVYLNSDYSHNLLGDNNLDLINLYQYLQKEGNKFIKFCKKFFDPKNNERECFNDFRHQFNETTNKRLRAALFIYLNRHGYNGLCRYNSSGKFNVPFGRYVNPGFPEKKMQLFHQKSATTIFKLGDFISLMQEAKTGDVVYCDPPYVPLSATAFFTRYSRENFGEENQIALAKEAKRLAKKNIPVIISNHDTPFTRELYHEAKIISFPVRRSISSNAQNRHPVQELLAVFGVKNVRA